MKICKNLDLTFIISLTISPPGTDRFLRLSHPTPGSIISIYLENPYLPSLEFALDTLYFILIFFKLSLNNSPLCTFHNNLSICDISHLIFNYPKLSSKRAYLNFLFNSSNILFDTNYIFSSPNNHFSFYMFYPLLSFQIS